MCQGFPPRPGCQSCPPVFNENRHPVGQVPRAAEVRGGRRPRRLLRLLPGAQVLSRPGAAQGHGRDRRGSRQARGTGCRELEHPEGVRGHRARWRAHGRPCDSELRDVRVGAFRR